VRRQALRKVGVTQIRTRMTGLLRSRHLN
jgi:hypothetical protein